METAVKTKTTELGDSRVRVEVEVPSEALESELRIRERVGHVAPFVRRDNDPYQVILNGRLLWIQDAYTWTNRYPDSTSQGGANYLRNSVKVTIDDYDGSMRFYAIQPQDPILQVWMQLYPTMFTSLDQAPPGLTAHFRYPEDLLNAQAALLATYHMTDPQTFYNREDLWNIAQETYGDRIQQMQTYFTTLRLPGEAGTEFASILPFTPSGQNRNNMLAWMVARSDAPHYGEVVVYRFPQGKLVFGPQQIEARMHSQAVPGLALAIVKDQEILYAHGFGVTSVEDGGIPVTSRTLFLIGSTAKPLTGTAIMRLVEAGKLDLDLPVKTYVDWLTFHQKGAEQQITLRMLLSHTAGLPSSSSYFGRSDSGGLEAYVREQILTREFVAPPGKLYFYSNDGLVVAGYLAEVVSGQPFPDLKSGWGSPSRTGSQAGSRPAAAWRSRLEQDETDRP